MLLLSPLRRTALVGVSLAASLVSSSARADDRVVEGTIVGLDHGELVIDLGSARGAKSGDVVDLYRPLVLRHPVSGKPLRDRFFIGRLVLGQVRGALSLATVEGAATREAAVGDIVVLAKSGGKDEENSPIEPAAKTTRSAGTKVVKQPVEESAPAASGATPAALDEDATFVTALLASVAGTDPLTRAARYEDAARARPTSRFARVLLEEAVSLRGAQAKPSASSVGSATTPAVSAAPLTPRLASLDLPERLLAGQPFELALRAAHTRGAVLHVRAEGGAAYLSRAMVADGVGYFRLALPPEALVGPSLALFVEGTDERGAAVALVGTASSPVVVPVESNVTEAPRLPGMLVQANLFGEYALYDLGTKQDRAFQTEGSFGVRLGEGQLRAVRSGYGVYRGVGGTLQELDVLRLKGRPVGLTYGWLEAEWAPWSSASFIGRVVIGVGRGGLNGGGQGFVRIGHDRRTNLLLGGEILGGVGVRGVAELNWNTLPRVPITLRTEVTNQPAGLAPRSDTDTESQGATEIGARAIVQVGYRITPSFVLYGRGSYQGRTIHHAGPGLGAGATFEW